MGIASTNPDLLLCDACGAPVAAHLRHCPACQGDVGFPNVRAAALPAEREALNARYQDALTSAEARKCGRELAAFEASIDSSVAVICRSIGRTLNLLSSESDLYASFYKQVGSNQRLPTTSQWDQSRQSVDALLFPYYYSEIVFGSLSADGLGQRHYGECSLSLKTSAIRHRTSTFEENCWIFCIEKHKLVVGSSVPRGFRSTWGERRILAVAKLHSAVNTNTSQADYAKILQPSASDPQRADFIELHIYGEVHRHSIAEISIATTTAKEDKVLERKLRRLAKDNGISVRQWP